MVFRISRNFQADILELIGATLCRTVALHLWPHGIVFIRILLEVVGYFYEYECGHTSHLTYWFSPTFDVYPSQATAIEINGNANSMNGNSNKVNKSGEFKCTTMKSWTSVWHGNVFKSADPKTGQSQISVAFTSTLSPTSFVWLTECDRRTQTQTHTAYGPQCWLCITVAVSHESSI